MLRNEFLEDHRKLSAFEAMVAELQATIEKISARLEARETTGMLAENR